MPNFNPGYGGMPYGGPGAPYPFGQVAMPPAGYMMPNFMQQQQMQQPQVQQMPQQSPASPLPGRMVQTAEEIAPNEVLMDGSTSFFPAKDGSFVLAKSWNGDGTIKTVKFVPQVETPVIAAEPTKTEESPSSTEDLKNMMEIQNRSILDKLVGLDVTLDNILAAIKEGKS